MISEGTYALESGSKVGCVLRVDISQMDVQVSVRVNVEQAWWGREDCTCAVAEFQLGSESPDQP